jgi:outer membrane protein assembly factor BamB
MRRRPPVLVLAAIAILLAVAIWVGYPRPITPPPPPAGPRVVWQFEAPGRGAFVAAPWVADDAVYAGAVHEHGLRRWGAVYALDPATGKRWWAFDAGGAMHATASAPVLAGKHLYFGEGMHANFTCRFRCLDAATGRPVWDYETTDHIEATATVADGVAYFGAGNDGVYALDAATGKRRWQFTEDLHIDASPCVAGGRVFAGSGPSRRFKDLKVVGLDAATGRPLWRTPVNLPAWGSPSAAGGRVFVGLGNGRLTEGAKPPETPAGAVVCLDAADGRVVWTAKAADAVFQRPTPDGDRVYFGSRDGHLYAVRQDTGEVIYKLPTGGPVIAPPTVADGKLYVVTVAGLLRCLAADDGRELWRFDVKKLTDAEPQVYAGVRVRGGRVYLATEVRTGAGSLAILYCLEQ